MRIGELDALAKELDLLSPNARVEYRDANAKAIARHVAERIFISAKGLYDGEEVSSGEVTD